MSFQISKAFVQYNDTNDGKMRPILILYSTDDTTYLSVLHRYANFKADSK